MSLLKNKGFIAKGVAKYENTLTSTLSASGAVNMFATESYNSSSGIVKLSDTQVKLLAGKKYEVLANVGATLSATNATCSWQLYNVTTSNAVGSVSYQQPATSTNAVTGAGVCNLIVAPSTDTTIELRLSAISTGTATVTAGYANCKIEEVEAYLAVSEVTAGATIRGAAAKTTLVAADAVGVSDSAASGVLKLATIDNLSTYVRTGIVAAPAALQIGEEISTNANISNVSTNAYANVATLTFTTAGNYFVTAGLYLSTPANITGMAGKLTTKGVAPSTYGKDLMQNMASPVAVGASVAFPGRAVNITAQNITDGGTNVTVVLSCQAYGATNAGAHGFIDAIRIA